METKQKTEQALHPEDVEGNLLADVRQKAALYDLLLAKPAEPTSVTHACQYAQDVGMPEFRCAVQCQYASDAATSEQHIHLAWRGALEACGVGEADREAISEVVLSILSAKATGSDVFLAKGQA